MVTQHSNTRSIEDTPYMPVVARRMRELPVELKTNILKYVEGPEIDPFFYDLGFSEAARDAFHFHQGRVFRIAKTGNSLERFRSIRELLDPPATHSKALVDKTILAAWRLQLMLPRTGPASCWQSWMRTVDRVLSKYTHWEEIIISASQDEGEHLEESLTEEEEEGKKKKKEFPNLRKITIQFSAASGPPASCSTSFFRLNASRGIELCLEGGIPLRGVNNSMSFWRITNLNVSDILWDTALIRTLRLMAFPNLEELSLSFKRHHQDNNGIDFARTILAIEVQHKTSPRKLSLLRTFRDPTQQRQSQTPFLNFSALHEVHLPIIYTSFAPHYLSHPTIHASRCTFHNL